MKKILSSFSSTTTKKITSEENYQYIVFEIVHDVIDKRKNLDSRYDQLIKKLWISEKQFLLNTFCQESYVSLIKYFLKPNTWQSNFVLDVEKILVTSKIILKRYTKDESN